MKWNLLSTRPTLHIKAPFSVKEASCQSGKIHYLQFNYEMQTEFMMMILQQKDLDRAFLLELILYFIQQLILILVIVVHLLIPLNPESKLGIPPPGKSKKIGTLLSIPFKSIL